MVTIPKAANKKCISEITFSYGASISHKYNKDLTGNLQVLSLMIGR